MNPVVFQRTVKYSVYHRVTVISCMLAGEGITEREELLVLVFPPEIGRAHV